MGQIKLHLVKGDITSLDLKIDAIVNPANSKLVMNGGLSAVIKDMGGEEIEKEAIKNAPISIGWCIVTDAGKLPYRYVIHAPTVQEPTGKSSVEDIRLAMLGVLKIADMYDMHKIAIPGLGTGVGKVPKKDAARTMLEILNSYTPLALEEVYLVAKDDEMFEAFKSNLESETELNRSQQLL